MRFFGEVGYGTPVEQAPGVWDDQITEVKYYGDVEQNTLALRTGTSVLAESSLQTSISVVADAYALENFTAIKYVRWAGTVWTVTSVKIQRPRLILAIGEVYHGPTAETP